jgi:bifunctional non-homologous end joining protein LigD
MPTKKPTDPLSTYRAKRSAEATPEPFTSAEGLRPGQFVVQKHAARRTHYDLRLEWNGTLWSWAVPNGPSLNPADKRLAVHVEDHPVEYADFEGVIPKNNYGAGAMIVWDKGTWVPLVDPDQGLVSGKIHFELHGYKLHGEWELIRPNGSRSGGKPNEWLLFKKKDAWAVPKNPPPFDERSILSGLTVEELGQGDTRAEEVRATLDRLGAPRRPVDPESVEFMLAETAPGPFSSDDWIYEIKYDGFRLLAARKADGSAGLYHRSGTDVTFLYPDLARAVKTFPYDNMIIDGEVVVLNEAGHPDFQRLQKRAMLKRRADIEPATVALPATLFAFDLLAFEDYDLRPLPLLERKALLKMLLPPAGPIRYADHVEGQGEALYDQVSALGLEGVLAKRRDVPYRAGRSPHWLKVKADRHGDFAVCGFSEPKGVRTGIGALHLALLVNGRFAYAGRVGTGFSDQLLQELRDDMEPVKGSPPKDVKNFPRGKGHWWVEPRWVAEVRYKTWTSEGLLRHPVFIRLRADKRVEECVGEGVFGGEVDPESIAPTVDDAAVPPGDEAPAEKPAAKATWPGKVPRKSKGVVETTPAPGSPPAVTRPEKMLWPDDGYTKGDLVAYYDAVSPWLLPYLRERPLVLTRYPDGISGKSFYQKNAPEYVPQWLRTETIWSESAGKEIEYFVCDTREMLLYLANLGTIPLHVWPSRVGTIQNPDWSIIDLDPKGAPFEQVVRLARATHDLCRDMGLEPFIKTSGSTGLHVLIPLGGQCTFEQSRMLANLLALILEQENRAIATTTRTISARGGKVYLDYLQNRHGQLLVAPFSVRPLPGAPVSMPLTWEEVDDRLEQGAFTIRTVPERLSKMKEDPLRRVMTERPDLRSALGKLEQRLRG